MRGGCRNDDPGGKYADTVAAILGDRVVIAGAWNGFSESESE